MPSPERLFQFMNAHVLTQSLRGAIELDLFTAIAEGATAVPALAARIGGSERGTRILCDYLAVTGLLTKQDGAYGLAEDAAVFLDRRSPAYMGLATRFLNHPEMLRAAEDVATAVRKGGSTLPGRGTLEVEDPVWVDFARGMAPMMVPAAEQLAVLAGPGPMRVLDVAAGHGIFGCTVAARNPEARVTALDWAPVLAVAADNAARMGVADRWEALPGSAFEVDPGTGYDVILLTNFLHHFSPEVCTEIVRKLRGALAPGGRLMTLEFIPNAERTAPPAAAAFSITMLLTTPEGDAYTFGEFEAMFTAAGFSSNELLPVTHTPQHIIVSRV